MTKLLKKSLAVVLSVALCLSVMVCGFVASADGEPTITLVASNATPAAGDTVTIDVKVANFDAVAGAQFTVDLGELALVEDSITSTVDAEFVEAYVNVLDGSIRLVNENVDDELVDITTANGVLFSFEVSVPANAVAEDAFTVDFANAKFCEATDGEPEVAVKAEAATLTVTVPVVGPVEPTEPDAKLKNALMGTFLAIGSKLGFFYSVYFDDALIDSLGYEFDSIALKVESPVVDGQSYNFTGETKTVILDSSYDDAIFDDSALEYGYHSYGITYAQTAMYEMMVPVTPTLLLYNDGVLVGYYTDKAKTLAEVAVDYYTTLATNDTDKRFAVDFLNMGSAAQIYFNELGGGNTSINPAVIGLPNDTDMIDKSLVTEYVFTEEDMAYDTNSFSYEIYPLLQMLTAPTFFYAIYVPEWTTPADITFNASYTSLAVKDEAGNPKKVEKVINGATSDPSLDISGAADGSYGFAFDDVALYDGNKDVTFTIEKADGTSYYYTRSLDSFLAESLSNTTEGTLYDLYDAVAAFSASTRNFWPEY